jgi:VanZ family protein
MKNMRDSLASQRAGAACSSPCLLLQGYLLLVGYGSLVPFDYQPLPLDEALDRFRALPYYHLGLASRADLVANFLLYMPLGFLAMAALCGGRTRRADVGAALLVVPAWAALSLATEFVQLYFPSRTTSLNDVYAESAGAAAGVLLWAAAGRRVVGWLRGLRAAAGAHHLAAQLLPAYLILLVVIEAMPLDLTLSPRELYQKYREGRILLVPFAALSEGAFELLRRGLGSAALFAPIGLLAAHLRGPAWRGGRGWVWALGLGLGAAAAVELVQLFVYTRRSDLGDLLTGMLAVLAGWSAARAYQRLRPAARVMEPAEVRPWRRGVRSALLAAWLGLVVVLSWAPFDFDAAPKAVARRLDEVSLLPFADYYFGTEYSAFRRLLVRLALFAPLGALLVPRRGKADLAVGVRAVLAAVTLAAGLEAGQLFLPGRRASVTDVMIAGAAAGLGFLIGSRLRAALGTAAVEERQREFCG